MAARDQDRAPALRSGDGPTAAPLPRRSSATVELARELVFDFTATRPSLPPRQVGEGHTDASWLRRLTLNGAATRYGPRGDATAAAYRQLEHELEVITQMGFAGYFLIVHEIVEFCRDHDILCQGRESAANSAVCFALGITAVDPVHHRLLFERFLSTARDGPPDIDIDNARREEVLQHVYTRYGRQYAAMVCKHQHLPTQVSDPRRRPCARLQHRSGRRLVPARQPRPPRSRRRPGRQGRRQRPGGGRAGG